MSNFLLPESATNAMTCCLEFSFVIALWGKKHRIKMNPTETQIVSPTCHVWPIRFIMKNLWSIQVSGSKVLDPGPFEARGNFSLRRICSNPKGRIVILSSMALFSPLKFCNFGSSKTCVWMLSATSLLKNTKIGRLHDFLRTGAPAFSCVASCRIAISTTCLLYRTHCKPHPASVLQLCVKKRRLEAQTQIPNPTKASQASHTEQCISEE